MANRKKSTGNLIECKCNRCGATLSPENAREDNDSITGFSALCVDCEQAYFDRLAQAEGKSLALFHCCAALNAPCKPIALDGVEFDKADNAWLLYLEKLAEKGLDRKGKKPATFFDGETNILRIFGRNMTESDFAKYIQVERTKIEKLVGSQEQREKWGVDRLYRDLPMTQEIYDELDRQFEIRANEFKGQSLSLQQEDTLMEVAKSKVIYAHLMRTGQVKLATDVQKSIDMQLASEQLRKKDEKPMEELSLSAIVEALESAGLMESGELLTYDELIEVLRDKHIKSKKYNYSLDVADQVILNVINSMRANADLMQLTELDEQFAAEDAYGEFEPEETEQEKENKRYAELTKVNVVKASAPKKDKN